MDDYEVVAQELSQLGEKIRGLDERVAEVERVNARLAEAALSTARALGEVSRHWDAVYEAMRRIEEIDPEESSERDNQRGQGASHVATPRSPIQAAYRAAPPSSSQASIDPAHPLRRTPRLVGYSL